MVAKAGVSVDELDEMANLPAREVITSGGQKRSDPQPAPTDAVSAQGKLVRGDPKKHYVWVSKTGDPTFNIGTYLALGYKIERFSKDDPEQARPAIGFQEYAEGDAIEAVACVLMSCSREHKAKLDLQGQAQVDRIEKVIRHGRVDPLTPADRAQYQHIHFERHGEDNRPNWEF